MRTTVAGASLSESVGAAVTDSVLSGRDLCAPAAGASLSESGGAAEGQLGPARAAGHPRDARDEHLQPLGRGYAAHHAAEQVSAAAGGSRSGTIAGGGWGAVRLEVVPLEVVQLRCDWVRREHEREFSLP